MRGFSHVAFFAYGLASMLAMSQVAEDGEKRLRNHMGGAVFTRRRRFRQGRFKR